MTSTNMDLNVRYVKLLSQPCIPHVISAIINSIVNVTVNRNLNSNHPDRLVLSDRECLSESYQCDATLLDEDRRINQYECEDVH